MKSQYEEIKRAINLASKLPRVDPDILERFRKRIEKSNELIRDDNPKDHFSTFFAPFIAKTKQIFIGDHIKAGAWLVPGGHIDKREHPVETVVREIKEELDMDVTTDSFKFFDLSIIDVSSSYPCKRHYDFWYVYPLDEQIAFNYTKDEYNSAVWMSINKAIKLTGNENQKNVLKKLAISSELEV